MEHRRRAVDLPPAVCLFGGFNGRVCRSGQTTGWNCGVVTAFKQTVHYETAISYAQGVTSGGSGNCDEGGGITFFQPVKEILKDYELELCTDD